MSIACPFTHCTGLKPCLEQIWNRHAKLGSPGTPECPWGCRTPLPPRNEWKISFHLAGTISVLQAHNRQLIQAFSEQEPGAPGTSSYVPPSSSSGSSAAAQEELARRQHENSPAQLRSRVESLHSEVNPENRAQHMMVLILGQSAAGKSMIAQFCVNPSMQTPQDVAPTTGMDLKRVQPFQKLPLRFDVMDTAGQERFRSISLQSVRRAVGIVWVLDFDQEGDLYQLDNPFLRQAMALIRPNVPVLFLANKIDLFRKKHAQDKEAQKRIRASANRLVQLAVDLLREAGDPDPAVLYSEVCALTGENIGMAFHQFYLMVGLFAAGRLCVFRSLLVDCGCSWGKFWSVSGRDVLCSLPLVLRYRRPPLLRQNQVAFVISGTPSYVLWHDAFCGIFFPQSHPASTFLSIWLAAWIRSTQCTMAELLRVKASSARVQVEQPPAEAPPKKGGWC